MKCIGNYCTYALSNSGNYTRGFLSVGVSQSNRGVMYERMLHALYTVKRGKSVIRVSAPLSQMWYGEKNVFCDRNHHVLLHLLVSRIDVFNSINDHAFTLTKIFLLS